MTSTQIKKLKAFSDLILAWLSIVGTLLGGGYVLVQYVANSNAERAKETLKFVERFEKDKLYESKQKIDIALEKMEENLKIKFSEGESEYSDYLKNAIKETSITSELNQVFDFYDQLQVCNLASLCDTEISLRFFGKYAYDLLGTIYPYIQQQRSQSGDIQYGSGILSFFNEYKKISIKTTNK